MDSKTREGRTREPLRSERGSSLARILATAALIAAVVLVALAMFGGGGSYKVKAVFDNAGQLVPGNQIRIGGVAVGKISDIELDDRANAVITMRFDDGDFTPPKYVGAGMSCNACHSRVGQLYDVPGQIYREARRGDDGRFSWHPFNRNGEIDSRWPVKAK